MKTLDIIRAKLCIILVLSIVLSGISTTIQIALAEECEPNINSNDELMELYSPDIQYNSYLTKGDYSGCKNNELNSVYEFNNKFKEYDSTIFLDHFENDNSKYYISHMLTEAEVSVLKETVGVWDPDTNYNVLINGHGTGLAPPAKEEWAAMIGTVEVVDNVSNVDLPAKIDHSQSPYFPEVRSQGSQASCTSWMTTYFAQGYYQAREYGWTQASTGNNSQLLNPSWTYNKVNKGFDKGSNFWRNWRVLNTIGAVTWSTMPYNSKDHLSWGSESAWRQAPKFRAGDYKQTNVSNIDVVRAWVNDGFICSISIDAAIYDGLGPGDENITSMDINTTTHNHANAVVGYDDNKVVGGELGAFKIVNSWGKTWGTTKGGVYNTGGWNGDGFYWMTYKAFTKLVKPVYMFYDKVAYEPVLLATWNFTGNCSRDATINLYLDSTSTPIATRELYRNAGKHNYPQFMCLDISEFINFASLNKTYLKITSGTNTTSIASFKL